MVGVWYSYTVRLLSYFVHPLYLLSCKKKSNDNKETHFPQCFLEQVRVEKIPFNVFRDEIWTGELNYSPVCAARSDDNIVPSRPETQNTKRCFCRVGNCQRSTPLSCLCMHKEHQRLVSDPQMDDLNVTLARPQRQTGKETLRIVRGGSFLCCHPPTPLSSIPALYLIVCLSIVPLSLWFSYLTLLLSCSFAPPPCLSSLLSITLFLSHIHLFPPSLSLSWSPLMEERPILLSLLMRNGKQSPQRTLTGTLTQITKPRG